MNVQPRPLKVAALGMEQRTYNTLQLFFSDRCNNHYVLSDEKSADIVIIDMDGYQASRVLESHQKNYPHQPAIILSLKENLENDAVLVRKPIQLSALASALYEARQRIGSKELAPKHTPTEPVRNYTPLPVNTGKPVSGSLRSSALNNEQKPTSIKRKDLNPVSRQNKTANRTVMPKIQYFANTDRLKAIQEESKRFLKTFQERSRPASPAGQPVTDFKPGVNDSGIRFVGDLNTSFNPVLTSKLQYNAQMSLQGYVSLAYKIAITSANNVVVEGPWRPILILHQTREICVERDFRHLFALSAMTFKKEDVSIYGQEHNLSVELSDQMVVQPIEQFLWKLALRTSQGRVPAGTDLETPIKLTRWPNFTRYEVTPHALRIAALWAKQPTSLMETAQTLMIPQQYVFAFYSAAYATGMLTHITETKSDDFNAPLITNGAHRNMLQNLLDRLRRF